jgi:hypothetical protein
MRAMLCLLLVSTLHADEQTLKMTARLSEEADAFQRLAPEVLGTEKLHQHSQKPPARFRPRIGNGAIGPPAPVWKDRDIVSEYAFTTFAGMPTSLHELRQVVSVDGRKVADTKKAQAALAKTITSTDDARKKDALKQFEKYGLVGAVTDFGQLILLFTRRELERYEFTFKESQTVGYDRILVFTYKQLDGPEALTLIAANRGDQLIHLKVHGEVWVHAENYLPMRITLGAIEGDAPNGLREEASVDYAMSPYGAVLPTATEHREWRGGIAIAENRITYADFHKFGASSDIKFDVAK